MKNPRPIISKGQARQFLLSAKLYVLRNVTSPIEAIGIFIPYKDIVDAVGCAAGVVNSRKIVRSCSHKNSISLVFHTK